MPLLYFLLYLLVEVGALVWLGSTIGVLWTVFVIVALSAVGMLVVRSQGRRVLAELRSANATRKSPGGAVADGAMVALGSVLLVIPGVVSSVVGLLLMVPLTRRLLRPLITRSAERRVRSAVASGRVPGPRFGSGYVVIDGDVVNGGGANTRGTAAGRPNGAPVDHKVIEGHVIDPDTDRRG